ncbi:MAG: polyphosphate polymerase domain-containing protein [Blautia sp.]|nr:polyphosphate polymerase domain-containing protein [Blautia sp.]
MNEQLIFKRYEMKYLLTREQEALLKQAMQEHMVPDVHGKSTILSLYFDTPNYLLARRSMEHPLYKEKLRLRSYGLADADSDVFMELKKKYDSVVYKRRTAMTEEAAKSCLLGDSPADTQIAREIEYCISHYAPLAPKVLISYERESYYGKSDMEFRVTFDRNILWRDSDVNLTAGIYGAPLLADDQVLMELKTGHAIPLWMAQLLSENHIYRTSFSKYGRAYAALCGGRRSALHKTADICR